MKICLQFAIFSFSEKLLNIFEMHGYWVSPICDVTKNKGYPLPTSTHTTEERRRKRRGNPHHVTTLLMTSSSAWAYPSSWCHPQPEHTPPHDVILSLSIPLLVTSSSAWAYPSSWHHPQPEHTPPHDVILAAPPPQKNLNLMLHPVIGYPKLPPHDVILAPLFPCPTSTVPPYAPEFCPLFAIFSNFYWQLFWIN